MSQVTSSSPKLGAGVPVRLTIMMVLEFFVPGTFVATLGLVLSSNGLASIIGLSYTLAAVAAIASPMFLGALGDRLLQTQWVLGLSHILGGVLLLFLPSAVQAGNGGLVLLLIFVYKLFYQPTVGLANSIALRHLGERKRFFPYVRVFGTLGWVAAGLSIGALGFSASTAAFIVTAVGSFVMGAYCFTLPRTLPGAKGERFSFGDMVGAKAFVLLRNRSFLVFMICAILTSVSLGTYNSYASPFLGALGIENVAGVLAIGQLSEVIFIVSIPVVIRYIGMKGALLTGMAMWGVRFLLFGLAAQGGSWLAIAAIALHGICSDFFVVIGAMYIDRVAPIQLQAQAQSMLILVIQGVGAALGSFVAGTVYNATIGQATDPAPADWAPLWVFPIVAAVITTILWLTLFRGPKGEEGRIVIHHPKVAANA